MLEAARVLVAFWEVVSGVNVYCRVGGRGKRMMLLRGILRASGNEVGASTTTITLL